MIIKPFPTIIDIIFHITVYCIILQHYLFNYDYVKIHFNMAIKILQTFSRSYHFIKIQQNKTVNIYFQEPSSICESEFKAYRLPYDCRPQHFLGFLTARFSQVCTRCTLYIKNTSVNFHASSVLVFLSIGTELRRMMMMT